MVSEEKEEFEEVVVENEEEPMESDEDEFSETEAEKHAQFEDLNENATMIFDRHTDSVFCCRTSPNGEYIASGGQDDRGYIYQTDGKLVMALFGHKESVVSVSWNKDSSLLASADLSGLIKVWCIKKKSLVREFQEEEIEFIMFHNFHRTCLLAAQSDGNCYLYSVADGNFKILPGPAGVSTCKGFFFSSGKHLMVCYQDSSLRVFDLVTTTCVSTISIQNEIKEIITCDMSDDFKTILIGSSTGQVCTLNMDDQYSFKLTHSFKTAEELQDDNQTVEHPVETLAFWKYPERKSDLFVAASLSGFVYVYENSKLRLKLLHPDGINGAVFCPGNLPRIMTSCLDGKLRIWDCRNGDLLITLHGHTDIILDLSIMNMFVTTASDDHSVRFWDLNELNENK